MADRKITDLTALAAGSQATGDLVTIVDVSEAAAADKNKKMTMENLFKGIPGDVGISTASPREKLHVSGSGDVKIEIETSDDDNVGLEFTSSASNFIIQGGNAAGNGLRFVDIQNSSAERMRIDSSGNVGIGTSSPTVLLDLESTSPTIRLTDSDASGTPECQISGAGGDLVFEADRDDEKSDSLIRFEVDGSETARIDSSGNLGIGTTSPDEILHVANTGGGASILIETNASSGGNLLFGDDGSNTVGRVQYVHSDNSMRLHTNGSERMRIDSSGRVGIGTSSPASVLNISASSGGDTSGLRITRTDSGGGDWRIWSSATVNGEGAGKLIFGNSGNRVCIDSSGNVGIGTTSISNKLEVDGGSAETRLRVSTTGTDANEAGIILANSGKTSYNDGIEIAHGAGKTNFNDLAGEAQMTIDVSNSRVGIGETSPDRQVHITNTTDTAQVKIETTAGSGRAQIQYISPNGDWVQGIQGGAATGDFLTYTDGTKNIIWYTGGNEALRLQSGGGISFNGDTATANALDDYEEGTWTPSVTSTGYATDAQAGYYTKIGRLVTVHFVYRFSAIGTTNSSVQFSGLPFTVNSNLHMVGVARETTTSGDIFVAQVNANSTNFSLNSLDGVANSSNQIFLTGKDYNATISYFV